MADITDVNGRATGATILIISDRNPAGVRLDFASNRILTDFRSDYDRKQLDFARQRRGPVALTSQFSADINDAENESELQSDGAELSCKSRTG